MNQVFVHINNMAIQREIIFLRGKAYNITMTMNAMQHWHIEQFRYESIMAALSHLRFQTKVDEGMFIEDPNDGIFKPLSIWFADFGEEDDTFDIIMLDDDSIATYPTDGGLDLDGEECIEDDIETEDEDIDALIREDREERGL